MRSSPASLILPLVVGAGLLHGAALEAEPGAHRRGVARPQAPPGFVQLFVAGVVPAPEGHTLYLHDRARRYFVPLAIGESEALSISMRHERRRFDRPLTHDLLDSALRELGGRVVKVHVDDLRGGVFTATVFIKARTRQLQLDARPADAIALALGNAAPIFVSRRVIERASISSSDLEEAPGEKAPPRPETMPRPVDPGSEAFSL